MQTQAVGFDLTSAQFASLDAIARQPGIAQARLAAVLCFDRATIGGVLDRLEKKGLVQRQVSPRDRRVRQLQLTRAGAEVLAVMLPVVVALQVDVLALLNSHEQATFIALAQKTLRLR